MIYRTNHRFTNGGSVSTERVYHYNGPGGWTKQHIIKVFWPVHVSHQHELVMSDTFEVELAQFDWAFDLLMTHLVRLVEGHQDVVDAITKSNDPKGALGKVFKRVFQEVFDDFGKRPLFSEEEIEGFLRGTTQEVHSPSN